MSRTIYCGTLVIFLLNVLAFDVLAEKKGPPRGVDANRHFMAQRGKNLGVCVRKLNCQAGGWCEIRLAGKHPSISAVWPKLLDRKTQMVLGPRPVLVPWNGENKILRLDPSRPRPRWNLFGWENSGPRPGRTRVYSKWQYVERDDVFVGISKHRTGVWVNKHLKNMAGTTFSTVNLQNIIRQAPVGSSVTLPPGVYGQGGLFINKSLNVKMDGVDLRGVSRRRAMISVKCNDCDVTIEGFRANARRAGCIYGNCAAIKAEGTNFRLTVRRAHIDNSVMGILTDNRGGVLRVEDTVIENTGLNVNTRTLGHGIYAGQIDKVHLKNTTIRNVYNDGHIFKSRARTTILEKVKFLGRKGYHSRTIDLTCGGNLMVDRSVFQHGANTDNSDLISVGTEPGNCKTIEPANVVITNSIIIFDRDHSVDERARSYGPNALFNWLAPVGKIDIHGNKIVNLEAWSYRGRKNNVIVPDQSSRNTMCKTRNACGL